MNAVELRRVNKKLAAARAAQATALKAAEEAAVAAIKAGGTEVAVAQALGVNRLTVRKWIGKPNVKKSESEE